MGIAARYCLRELVAVFVVVFLVLMAISLGSRFTGYLQDAAAGELSATVLWLVLALKMPDFIQIVVPFSFYLAILLTLGRLDADSELPILQLAQVGPIKLFAWFGWILIPIGLCVAYLSFVVTPDAREKFLTTLTSQDAVSEFDVIKEDDFRLSDQGNRMTYMGKVDKEAMTVGEIFLQERETAVINTLVANEGRYHIDQSSDVRYLELIDGQRYVETRQTNGYSVGTFKKLTQRIELEAVKRLREDPSRIPAAELDSSIPSQRMEWHWRLAMPLITVISSILAFGIGRVKPRAGRFGKILPALLLFIAYYAMIMGSLNFLQTSAQWSFVGFWPVHAIMFLLGAYFVQRNWRPT